MRVWQREAFAETSWKNEGLQFDASAVIDAGREFAAIIGQVNKCCVGQREQTKLRNTTQIRPRMKALN
jgi:hypothetical protein